MTNSTLTYDNVADIYDLVSSETKVADTDPHSESHEQEPDDPYPEKIMDAAKAREIEAFPEGRQERAGKVRELLSVTGSIPVDRPKPWQISVLRSELSDPDKGMLAEEVFADALARLILSSGRSDVCLRFVEIAESSLSCCGWYYAPFEERLLIQQIALLNALRAHIFHDLKLEGEGFRLVEREHCQRLDDLDLRVRDLFDLRSDLQTARDRMGDRAANTSHFRPGVCGRITAPAQVINDSAIKIVQEVWQSVGYFMDFEPFLAEIDDGVRVLDGSDWIKDENDAEEVGYPFRPG